MNKRQQTLRRLLRALLPVIILSGIIIGSLGVTRAQIQAGTNHTFVRARVTAILSDYSNNTAFNGSQIVQAVMTSGPWKGQEVELSNTNSYQQGALCQIGTRVVAVVQESGDGTVTGSVYNYDRTGMLYILLGLFLVSLLIAGGKRGFATIYALAFTFACVVFLYIPLLYTGMNGVLAGVLASAVILTVSLYILNGWSRKTACAIAGTTAGVCISGGLAMLMGAIGNLTGYHMSEAESMVYIASATSLRVSDVLYAGILISSLGAVMDVSVSAVAAIEEVHAKAPELSARELFRSGMHMGRDIIGTDANTLILAYAGSATTSLLTIYAYSMPYLQTMSYNSVVIEIMSSLCGSIGVILTVPIQAAITTLFIRRRPRQSGR